MTEQQAERTQEIEGAPKALKRRGLIAGAAALVAGIAAKQTAQPVAASTALLIPNTLGATVNQVFDQTNMNGSLPDGTAILNANANGSFGNVIGLLGQGGGPAGAGVMGLTNGFFYPGAGVNVGVYGGARPNAYGVQGVTSGPNGRGVFGSNTSGDGVGVRGECLGTGTGVTGRSSTGVGVRGLSAGAPTDSGGTGVYGAAYNPQGVGVLGICNSAFGIGTVSQSASFVGAWGQTTTGTAVLGDVGAGADGASNTGVQGRVGVIAPNGFNNTTAVSGYNQSTGAGGVGVRGQIPNTTNAGETTGVHGINQSTGPNGFGVLGVSTGGPGVVGTTSGTGLVAGLYGTSSTAYGILGNTTAVGYSGLTGTTNTPGAAALAATALVDGAFAAYFKGYTVVEGNFAVTGNKAAAVAHPDGTHRLLYCMESPEAWFEDFGEAKLVGGKADVKLDPDFAALVHVEEYHVFLTPHGDTNGLHVLSRSATGFIVQEHKSGTNSLIFSWRVVAKRKGNPGGRLEKFTMPKINTPDPAKLPKLPPLPPSPPKKP
ncbi:MAG: hypothetical protein ACYDAR_09335 [Thermomicrobiales bacterium]